MYTLSIKTNIDKRGQGVSDSCRQKVGRLSNIAFEIRNRLDNTEHAIVMLEETLGEKNKVVASIDRTYEAHSFERLRYQLFRLAVTDIYASVLDRARGAISIKKIINDIEVNSDLLLHLKEYYSDTSCLEVHVEKDADISEKEIEEHKKRAIEEHITRTNSSIDNVWEKIKANKEVLEGRSARRIVWMRNNLFSHFKSKSDGLAVLGDPPPAGSRNITWGEPGAFFRDAWTVVSDVLYLLTATSWTDDWEKTNRFYACAFWERFKNGSSALKPEDFGL